MATNATLLLQSKTAGSEDYPEGLVCQYRPVRVSEEEIIDFARKFDPQALHVDPVAAADGPFGGLIASGVHTLALASRMFVENFLTSTAHLGSPGIDDLRWLRPVRPGDELMLHVTVTFRRQSPSKPDRGLIGTAVKLLNQNGDVVLMASNKNFVRTRDRSSSTANPAIARRISGAEG